MIFLLTNELIDCKCIHGKKSIGKPKAFVLDNLTAVALTVIGYLGLSGILSLSPSASWAMLGGGAVYLATVTLYGINQTVIACRQ